MSASTGAVSDSRGASIEIAPGAMTRHVAVALVMPVRNEGPRVNATMAAILASTRLPDEIVIGDGMSTDDTVARFLAYAARGVPVRVVQNPARFSGGGRNVGARATSAEVIVFADCGNPVAPDWIAEMVRPFEETADVDIVCGIFEPLVTNAFEHCLAAIHYPQNYRFSVMSAAERQALVPRAVLPGGGTIAMTRATFDAIGGYPEWLHRAQDKVFSRKAYALGMRVVLNWQARIAHHMRSDLASVFQLSFDYARGNGRSRFTNRHFVKLAGFYGGLALLLAAYPWFAPAPAFAATLFAAYTWHAGYRKLVAKDGCIRDPLYWWLAPAMVWHRDAGALLGQVLGWSEWCFVPKYKKLFRAYMASCDKARILLLEP